MSVRFQYRASTATGEMVDGVAEVGSHQGLLEQLRRRDLYPVEIREVAPRPSRRDGRMGRRKAVTHWARNFGTLLSAGTPADRALAITINQAGHAGLAQTLSTVRENVRGGEDLSTALARHPDYFPTILPAMVRAGEVSGTLETVFEQVATFLEESEELRAEVQSALLYPILMAVVAGLGVTVLLLFVVPRFAGILEDVGGTLPLTTRSLIWTGETLSRFWWLIGGAVAVAVVVGLDRLRRPEHRRAWHGYRLRLPLVGPLEQKILTARFARTLGLLLRNGTAMVPALDIARASVTNLDMEEGLARAAGAVAEGAPLAQATEDALPGFAVEMLAVGEESGRLDDMCGRIAQTYDTDVRRSLKTAISLIEPTLIVVFGVLVGFVALAMLQAIYSINTSTF